MISRDLFPIHPGETGTYSWLPATLQIGLLYPLRALTSRRIWNCLLDVFSRFGFSPQLITDNATNFTSRTFTKKCSSLGTEHKKTSPYNTQAKIGERVHRNLRTLLTARTTDHMEWDVNLSEMAFATHTTVNRSAGYTPAFLNFGRELSFPLSRTMVPSHSSYCDNRTFAQSQHRRLTKVVTPAREQLDNARLEQLQNRTFCC